MFLSLILSNTDNIGYKSTRLLAAFLHRSGNQGNKDFLLFLSSVKEINDTVTSKSHKRVLLYQVVCGMIASNSCCGLWWNECLVATSRPGLNKLYAS